MATTAVVPADELGDDESILRSVRERGILLHAVTWNMNAKEAPPDLSALLPRNRFHVYAVGTQECENTIARSLIFPAKDRWETAVADALGPRYRCLKALTLQATHLVIYAHAAIYNIISACLLAMQNGCQANYSHDCAHLLPPPR